jgi:hypothetical protein
MLSFKNSKQHELRTVIILGFMTAFVVAIYLLASSRVYRVGFPLDDAWIHQTYARNLGAEGQWAFLPGKPSSGSTSPLWSALLALGYWFRLPYFFWTFFLGGLSLFAVARLGEMLFVSVLPGQPGKIPWMGIFLAGEWHLAWAAVSGMETLLNAAMILLVLLLIGRARGRNWGWAGLLIGFSVWIRPDGVTLLGPALFVLFFVEASWKKRLTGLFWLAGGIALLFIPYLLFNLALQGNIWPNTFYAKQAEYAAAQEISIFSRYFNELKLPLIGSGLFLLPGFVFSLVWAWKKKNWQALAGAIWFLGYALLYALRLPVTYQYGRYLMPAMPVFFILGMVGTFLLFGQLGVSRLSWIAARVILLSGALVWLAFLGIGAGRYSQDVAIVETEMVASARWIAANTPPNALVAAHDIGAAGYFSNRQLVDLAGLISPDVISIIRDEDKLGAWLDEQKVDYLVVFEGWYSKLPAGKEVVYRTQGAFSPASGGSNMVIYRWRRDVNR